MCALLRTESHSNGALRDNTGAGHVMEGGGSGRRSGLRGQRAADDDLRVRRGAHARRQGACRGRLARCEREPLRSALRVKTRGHGNGVAATSRAPCKVSANGGGGALAPRNVHKTCVVHEQRARGGERGPGAPPAWCGWPWARSETPPAAAGSAPGACWHEAFLTARVCSVGAMCAHTWQWRTCAPSSGLKVRGPPLPHGPRWLCRHAAAIAWRRRTLAAGPRHANPTDASAAHVGPARTRAAAGARPCASCGRGSHRSRARRESARPRRGRPGAGSGRAPRAGVPPRAHLRRQLRVSRG